MGCRPDGHFNGVKTSNTSLAKFQWAVAQMVTFTSSLVFDEDIFRFQWAVARIVTFTKLKEKFNLSDLFQWAVAQMVTFTNNS